MPIHTARSSIFIGYFSLLCLVVISACQPAAAQPGALASPTAVQFPTDQPSPSPVPLPSATPEPSPQPDTLWLPNYLPEPLAASIKSQSILAPAAAEEDATVRFDLLAGDTEISHAGVDWVYALAAPFPTISDEVSGDWLRDAWTNGPQANVPVRTLLVDPSTFPLLEKKWGKASGMVKTVPQNQMLDAAWEPGGVWAILPFDLLEPRWKVIAVDGQSPVRKDFDPRTYPLTLSFGLTGNPQAAEKIASLLPPSNRLPEKMTVVVVTGVTALVRGTASLMEGLGMTYPAQDIGGLLRDADILHISNEVPFAENCPQPFDWRELVFCSQTEYIKLLEDVGTDVVELTGDHFKDWGPEAMLYTLKLYQERGWKYYGGGANAAEANQPAIFEHHGNRIAFTGCNAKEPGYAGASDTSPGAIHCDFDEMEAKVKKLSADGYLPIVTFQHLEYYQYAAHPILKTDFHKMADSGAVIVSGSQAHQPHAFELLPDSFLHYGLGNLFFDQTNQGDEPRTAFIDRHIFYNGRHISTELLTIYLVDYARSRPMTPDERRALLKAVFDASGWSKFTTEP
jgi:hypothetical protein